MKKSIRSTVKDAWQNVLKVQSANDNDNFFEQGGTSVVAIQLVFILSKSTERTISEFDFFTNPTLKNLIYLFQKSQDK